MDAAKSASESIVIETAAVALKQKRDKTHFAWQVYSEPKVAVIITHHNYSLFVEAAIDSVLCQTYGNFELVVVDDFSDIDHRARLREILAQKPAVKAIWNTTNIGQISSFYRAVNVSDANFFCALDPDDRYLPSFLEDMVSIHLNPYAYAGMACCDQLCIEDERQMTGVYMWRGRENALRGVDVTAQMMHTMKLCNWYDGTWPWSSTSSMMFRRSVVNLLHPHRDLDYKAELDSYLASGARYLGFTIIFDRPLVFRSVHQNSAFRSSLLVHIFENRNRPGWVDVISDLQVEAIISILNNGGIACMPWSHFKTVLLREFNIFQIARIRSKSEIAKKSLGQIELIAAKASQAAKLPWKKQILTAATAASRAAKLFWRKSESPGQESGPLLPR
jgi:glycosyltransferase involved in cell wall biosynthesis